MLTEIIIKNHILSCNKINSHVRGFLKRKEIVSYLSQLKTHYIIESGFNNSDDIQLKVFFDNNTTKIFNFEYCKQRRKKVIFFPKNKIEKKCYKVNFILNNQIIINPNFTCEELNGLYVNLINFESIQRKEFEKEKEFKGQIKYYLSYLKRKDINLIEAKPNLEISDYNENQSEDTPSLFEDDESIDEIQTKNILNSTKNKFKRSTNSSMTTMCNSFEFKSSKLLPTINPSPKLTRPKSILKMLRRKSSNSIKKVSFGNVQFSY